MQAAVVVKRPPWAPWLGHATVQRMAHATGAAEELLGLRLLRRLCTAMGDVVSLRLHARRLGVHALCDFEQRARRAGFVLADPEGVTRTLLLDLRESSEALLADLTPKTRHKVRQRSLSPFELRQVTDEGEVAALKAASLASVRRTGGCEGCTPWSTLLALAREDPKSARVIALSRSDGAPLAFVAGVRHGKVAEYLSAGSLDDPELRSHPFNYFLLWELVDWARAGGATHMDLGGVTDGGPDDPLARISAFKRHFTHAEVEIGREVVAVLRPNVQHLLDTARHLRKRARAMP